MAKKILIVDDDRVGETLIRLALQQQGFEVVSAADGLQALAEVRRSRPDLIVLDVQMPNMSGFEFMDELKTTPGGGTIAVIMLTANDNMQEMFLAEGVKGYFVKPVDPRKLGDKIRAVLGAQAFHAPA